MSDAPLKRTSLTEGIIALGGLSAFQMVAGIIIALLIPWLLSEGEFADYSVAFRAFTWVSAVAVIFVPPLLLRFGAVYSGKRATQSFHRLIATSALIQGSLVSMGVLTLLAFPKLLGLATDSHETAVVLLIMVVVFGVQQFTEAILRSKQAFAVLAFSLLYGTSLRVLLLAVLILSGATVSIVLGTLLLSLIVTLVMQMRAVRPILVQSLPKLKNPRLNSKEWDYGATMAIASGLSLFLWGYTELFFLEAASSSRQNGAEEVAAYGLAISLAIFPVRFAKSISQVMLPRFSELVGAGDKKLIRQNYELMTKVSMVVTIPLCAGLAYFSSDIFKLLFPDTFQKAAILFALLQIPTCLLCINQAGAAALPALAGHRYSLGILVLFAPMSFLSAYLIVPEYGATGAAMNNAVFQSAAIIATIAVLSLYRQLPFPTNALFRVMALVAASLLGVTLVQEFFINSPPLTALLYFVCIAVGFQFSNPFDPSEQSLVNRRLTRLPRYLSQPILLLVGGKK